MAMAMKEARGLIDRLLSAGYPSFVVHGELEKANIKQGDYKVSGYEEPLPKDYMISFSMPHIDPASKAIYDKVAEIARELELVITGFRWGAAYSLCRKRKLSKWQRLKEEPKYESAAEISSRDLTINAELPDAGEILEKIGSKVYGAKT